MDYNTVIFRVLLSLIFSTIVGYEREVNQSNAGLKTHTIVGVSATIIALMQAQISYQTLTMAVSNPSFPEVVRSDPARLLAQVVSGVGFLGAGTIIVTKRNVSGLTTAASIWFVASLGLNVGMGFYFISLIGFLAIILILVASKYLIKIPLPRRLIVKYLGGDDIQDKIHEVFISQNLSSRVVRFDVEMFHNEKIYLSTYEIEAIDNASFDILIETLSRHDNIVSVQLTNIQF